MEKGFNLQVEELKENLVRTINDSKMPIVVIEYILQGMLTETSILKNHQVSKEKEQYEKEIKDK